MLFILTYLQDICIRCVLKYKGIFSLSMGSIPKRSHFIDVIYKKSEKKFEALPVSRFSDKGFSTAMPNGK